MTIIVLNQGEQAFLQNGVTGVAYTLRLYTNDVTAGLTATQIDALTEAAFTEATFAGYSGQTLNTGDWSITVGDPTQAVNLEKSFIRSSTGTAQSVRGIYVTRNSDAKAMWFEPFPGPVVVEFINDEIEYTPLITLDDRSGNMTVPIGGSILWSGVSTGLPSGYLLRDGSAVSRTTYALLFAVLGTTYGVGDGSTTFNLPDQRGRFPLGVAASGTGNARGATGGTIDHVHNLETATAHARITMPTGSPSRVRMHRVTTTSWNENVVTGDIGVVASAAALTTGAQLDGNTDTANPPFLADYFIIRAL